MSITRRHPIRWPRAIAAFLVVLVGLVVVNVALELALPDRWWIADVAISAATTAFGLYVVLPQFRPWYRPAPPQQGQWTEDRL